MSIQDAVNAICKLYGHAPSGGPHLIYEVLGEFHPGHPDEAERERRRKELKFGTDVAPRDIKEMKVIWPKSQ